MSRDQFSQHNYRQGFGEGAGRKAFGDSRKVVGARKGPHPQSPVARAKAGLSGKIPTIDLNEYGVSEALPRVSVPKATPATLPAVAPASQYRAARAVAPTEGSQQPFLPSQPVQLNHPAQAQELQLPFYPGQAAQATQAVQAAQATQAAQAAQATQAAQAAQAAQAGQPQQPAQPSARDFSADSGRYKARPSVRNQAAARPGAAPTSSTAARSGSSSAQTATPQFLQDGAPQTGRKRKRTSIPRVAATLVVLAVLTVGGCFAYNELVYASPIKATVNGETMTLQGEERSIEGLLNKGRVSVTPGNYIAVDNSVIREGEGTRCTAKINEKDAQLKTHIFEGDSVVVSNGTDIMENYTDSEPTIIPTGFTREGKFGALHVFFPGQEGEMVTRTGSESGITVETTTKEKVDARLAYYNANTGGEKVVALTFDDGPWDSSTTQILDILKENDVKASFYTIGRQISDHKDTLKRMAEEGHEISTHTWDHADGAGKGYSLDLMNTAARQEEVQKGFDAIKEASGKEPSKYFRAPGGNFGADTANDLKGIIHGEVGWNVDTQDWTKPGAEAIAERIKSVQPGGIVLLHDGGGDRSQTVEALRQALPYLKSQGYKFVTISELIEKYPYRKA